MTERIIADALMISMIAVAMAAILVTYSEARPQQTQPRPQPQLHRDFDQQRQQQQQQQPQPSAQIAPRAARLHNVTAHTREILAKIAQVNRQHGYVRAATPKRSQFVPGYFAAHYNYKERVLKGFAMGATHRSSAAGRRGVYEAMKPPRAALASDAAGAQAQMSVDHVKHIVRTYQGAQALADARDYAGTYLAYGPTYYPPYEYMQFVPDLPAAYPSPPIYAYVPPDMYVFAIPPPPSSYSPYPGVATPASTSSECVPAVDEAKRAPKILDKRTAVPREFKDFALLLNERPTMDDATDVPAANQGNRTHARPPAVGAGAETTRRRNTKRPSIFRPHTWFNNRPMQQNTTADVDRVDPHAERVAGGGGGAHTKGILGALAPLGAHQRRKVFTKDSTGSGIFIHKLKVRKGGVAIAGPGGIATAGSGGTAIVGPNGYAFTQPDSLAIAGAGTKVIAVDPSVNLSELVGGSGGNGTLKALNATLGARVGKVVATGPVVYYNKG